MKWYPRRWNDILALLLLVGLPIYLAVVKPSDIVVGSFVTGWTLVVQFYFRRAPEDPQGEKS
jgi:hypothetical protein